MIRISVPFHGSVPTNRTLSSTRPFSVQLKRSYTVVSPNRRSREYICMITSFSGSGKTSVMVSDGARKMQAVVRMYHNSVFLGDTTFRKGLV